MDNKTDHSDPKVQVYLDAAHKVAAGADRLLGRKDPDDPLVEVEAIETSKVLPESVSGSEEFRIINKAVSIGSLGLAVIGLFGQGTFSAVTAAISVALSGSTTLGHFLRFGQAFWMTLALSISSTIFAYMTFKGMMRSWGAVIVWVAGTAGVVALLESMGIDGPAYTELTNRVGGKSPLGMALETVGYFASYYTPIPFISGITVGAITGWMWSEVERVRQNT